MTTIIDLEQFRVGSNHLRSLFLIPEYINEETERQLLTEISASRQAWKQVSGRRLQNW